MTLLMLVLTIIAPSSKAWAQTTEVNNWADLKTALEGGHNVVLTGDPVRTTEYESIRVNKAVTLDLNGHSISGGSKQGDIIYVVTNGNLTITDGSEAKNGKIDGAMNSSQIIIDESGVATLAAGSIGQPFGVSVTGNGRFTMTGGTINTGVGTGVSLSGSSSMTISGGTITGNDVGVHIDDDFDPYTSAPTLTVSGSPVIKSNTSADVSLAYDGWYLTLCPIIIGGALTAQASIGISTRQSADNVNGMAFTSGLEGKGSADNFFLHPSMTNHAIVTIGSELGFGTKIDLTGGSAEISAKTYAMLTGLEEYHYKRDSAHPDDISLDLNYDGNANVRLTATTVGGGTTYTATKISQPYNPSVSEYLNALLTVPGSPSKTVLFLFDNDDNTLEFYPVWALGCQFTSTNLVIDGNDLGSGVFIQATFDPATSTLTLSDNPDADNNDSFTGETMITSKIDLTIAGTCHMQFRRTADEYVIDDYGIETAFMCPNLTFAGNFTFASIGMTIIANNITLRSGRLALGSYKDYAIYCIEKLTVESTFEKLEMNTVNSKATGSQTLWLPALTMADNLSIVTPAGGVFDPIGLSIWDGETCASHIVIATEAAAEDPETDLEARYPIWLGSKQLTPFLQTDGYQYKYDAATRTLTLKEGIVFDGTHEIDPYDHEDVMIYAEVEDLTIEGVYHMSSDVVGNGVYMSGNHLLTLDGDFTFLGTISGIYTDGDVIVKSGNLTAKGYRKGQGISYLSDYGWGICCKGITIQSGITQVHLSGGNVPLKSSSLTLGEGIGITTPVGGMYKGGVVYEADGTTLAQNDVPAIFKPMPTMTMAKEGFGTYYNGAKDLQLAKGMKARIVTAKGEGQTLTYETIADGYVGTDEESLAESGVTNKSVPAGVAVLLQTAAGEESTVRTLTLTDPADVRTFASNLLHGSDVETTTTGDGLHYKLSYNTSGENVGWYWGGTDGAAFTSAPHKAWLVLPASGGARYFALTGDGDTTGIVSMDNGQWIKDNGQDDVWYDLSGRKIVNGKASNGKLPKGVYIRNGRKEVIR